MDFLYIGKPICSDRDLDLELGSFEAVPLTSELEDFLSDFLMSSFRIN